MMWCCRRCLVSLQAGPLHLCCNHLRKRGRGFADLTGESRLRFSARGDLLGLLGLRTASLASLSLPFAGLHLPRVQTRIPAHACHHRRQLAETRKLGGYYTRSHRHKTVRADLAAGAGF